MYVIKTMTTEEIEEMHHLLKQVSSQDVWIVILLRTVVTYPVNLPKSIELTANLPLSIELTNKVYFSITRTLWREMARPCCPNSLACTDWPWTMSRTTCASWGMSSAVTWRWVTKKLLIFQNEFMLGWSRCTKNTTWKGQQWTGRRVRRKNWKRSRHSRYRMKRV